MAWDPRTEKLDQCIGLLGRRGTLNTLKLAGIKTVGDLASKRPSELLELPLIGRKTIDHIRFALNEFGLALADDLPPAVPPDRQPANVILHYVKALRKKEEATKSVIRWKTIADQETIKLPTQDELKVIQKEWLFRWKQNATDDYQRLRYTDREHE